MILRGGVKVILGEAPPHTPPNRKYADVNGSMKKSLKVRQKEKRVFKKTRLLLTW
jgi:hypothetical protein